MQSSFGVPGTFAPIRNVTPFVAWSGPLGLQPSEASGYILGWVQDAQVEAAPGTPQIALDALAKSVEQGTIARMAPTDQVKQVYPVLAKFAPKTAARMRKEIRIVGTDTEQAAVEAGVAAVKRAGIPVRSDWSFSVPKWGWAAGGFLVFALFTLPFLLMLRPLRRRGR